MTIKLGIVMDPISAINIKKDSSFAMLEEAQKRGYELFYLEMKDLYMQAGRAFGTMRPLTVKHDYAHWFSLGEVIDQPLSSLDVILMRKDPPFDTEFIYATYMLERAEDEGCLIVNKPQSLRDANEKLYTAWFAEHTPTTLVTRRADKLRAFHARHKDVILKPLDGMGGASIFRMKEDDANVGVIIRLEPHGYPFTIRDQKAPSHLGGADEPAVLTAIEVVRHCASSGGPRGRKISGWVLADGEAPTPIRSIPRHVSTVACPSCRRRPL